MKNKKCSPLSCSDGVKRYHTLAWHNQALFGKKMAKLPLSAGFTCPNRDGSKGVGGCAWCSGAGGGEFAPGAEPGLMQQLEQGKSRMEKWPNAGIIAYFQAFSNTYGPTARVRALLDETIALPDVEAISLATRADCIDPPMAELLAEFARRIPLTVELGLQTAHDRTAEALGRGHSFAEFCAGYALLRERGVRICVHLIDGLPGESADMMRETAREVAALSPDGIKLHMLHLLRGTALAARYAQTPFSLLTREQYVGIVCDQLELLPESCVIERLTGDGAAENLIAPDWTRNKRAVLNAIDAELLRRDSWQGKRIG